MGGKETIECQINCFLIKHFYKTVDNKVIEFPLHSTGLTFNIDQVYFNTRAPTQANTNQHEPDTSQHESTRVQHVSTQA